MPVDWDAITGQREDMQELNPKKRICSFDEVALGYTKKKQKEKPPGADSVSVSSV